MPLGPGKYDKEVTEIRKRLKADGVILIVFGGKNGPGFSAQLPLHETLLIPKFLRDMADQIEKSGGALA